MSLFSIKSMWKHYSKMSKKSTIFIKNIMGIECNISLQIKRLDIQSIYKIKLA